MNLKKANSGNFVWSLAAWMALACLAPIAQADEADSNNDAIYNEPMAIESCVIRTTWDQGSSSLHPQVIEALLQSSGVWGRAVEEVFGDGKSGRLVHLEARLETLNVSESKHIGGDSLVTLVARLEVEVQTADGHSERAKTKILLKRVCDLLQKSLVEFSEATIMEQHERKAQLEAELNQARTEFHKIMTERQAFREKNNVSDPTYRNLVNLLDSLAHDRDKMELERSVFQARRDAMQEQVARLSKEATQEPVEKPVVEQLRKIVAIRQEALQKTEDMAQTGRISHSELDAIRVEVAQAQAELARAEEDAQRDFAARMHEMGGNFIVDMNHELTRMAIDEADMEAKYKATVERMHNVREALKVSEEFELLGGKRLDIARSRLEDVQRNLAEIERRIETTVRPKMTIIGMN
ncbi:MAG TPA: hypothetical protein PKN33_04335 [Phycisphaerae bacterium]|nr:hypothetical protein [Phycisphaerae bacterium]